MKRIIITVIITLMIVFILLGAHFKKVSSIVDVNVYTVNKTRIVSSITSNGRVEEFDKREIYISTPTIISEVKVKVGDEVTIGQQLFTLDTNELEMEIEKAKAEERLEWFNISKIIRDKNEVGVLDIQSKKWEIAKMRVKEFENKYNMLKETFNSPINGIVTSVNIREGILTNSIEPVLVISDLDNLLIKIEMREYYISKVAEGQQVEITGEAFEGTKYRGEISTISPVAVKTYAGQMDDTIIEVTAKVSNKKTVLKPGYSVKARVITEIKDDALIVPYEAIAVNEYNKEVVYVVKNNIVKKREIKTGAELDMAIEIIDGLDSGDKVILNPHNTIDEDVNVRIIEEREV